MDDSRRRTEPSGTTITDMMVLVLGCAIAFSLPDIRLWDDDPDRFVGCGLVATTPPPWWYRLLDGGSQAAFKVAIGLAIVALARCLRWRRTPRPVEWMAIIPTLWLADLGRNFMRPYDWDVFPELPEGVEPNVLHGLIRSIWFACSDVLVLAAWLLSGVVVWAMAASLGYRLSSWIRTLMAVVSVLAFVTGPMFFMRQVVLFGLEQLFSFGVSFAWIDWIMEFDPLLFRTPGGLMFSIALLASARERRRTGRKGGLDAITWIAMLVLAIYFLTDWYFRWPNNSLWITRELGITRSLQLMAWFAVIALTTLLATRWLGHTWNRAFGVSHDKNRPESPPSET